MPELPEVETVRRQLLPHLKGDTIAGVEVFHSKSVNHQEDLEDILVGKTIADINRTGKLLFFSFHHEPELYLLAHLKMTGQFFLDLKRGTIEGGGHKVAENDFADLPNRHTRVAFTLKSGNVLYFNDMRLFGYIKLANQSEMQTALSKFGPEPTAESFSTKDLIEKIRRRKTPVKAALLDQKLLAGLGNIYVDEALFKSKIHPTRLANTLSSTEVKTLLKNSGLVMNKAIKYGGTTFQHFADADGKPGNFTEHLRVFGKQGTICPQCKTTTIEKIRVAGRGTHVCPTCQK